MSDFTPPTPSQAVLETPLRVLYLSQSPALIRRQLAGETLTREQAGTLRDDVSTDEITPVHILSHYDDTLGDFVGVSPLAAVPSVLVVGAGSPIKNVAELIATAKAKPGQLNYASNGQGTSLHLSAELYKSQSGAFVTHIPYRGAAAGLTGLMAGEVNMMFDNLPSALGLINGGKLKALAVTTPQRSSALPNVPTMEEAGMKGYQVFAWFGVAAPAGLPAPIAQKLEQALERVASQPEVKAAMLKAGAEPAWANAQGLASFMQADMAQWKKVAAYAKINLD